jgi:hypothetical protein
MAAFVRFSGVGEDAVKVDEDIDEVAKLWKESKGEPLVLTATNGARIYVNPDRIAYLREPTKRKARVIAR